MGETPLGFWIGFNAFVLAMLALDLGVFHRRQHTVSMREALGWVAVWVTLGLSFCVFVYFWRGREHQPALEYLTGYLIELSLSMDNIFVFLVIFQYFGVRDEHQHRVLFWGIIGALVMRAGAIFAGVALLQMFHWMIYVLGAFLVFTGIRTAFKSDHQIHPDRNPVVRVVRKFLPIAEYDHSGRFFVRNGQGRLLATPLVLVLAVVETTDLIFALDSIPAILGVTKDPFIVYTSNVFAILGLRAMYFALAGLMRKLRFLHYGLAAVLVFVGLKMLAEMFHVELPIVWSLGIVAVLLGAGVAASLMMPVKFVPGMPEDQVARGDSQGRGEVRP